MAMAAFITTMKRGLSWRSLIVSWTLELGQISWVLWPWYTLLYLNSFVWSQWNFVLTSVQYKAQVARILARLQEAGYSAVPFDHCSHT